MAFDLYGLTNYTNENSGILIQKSVLGADLLNYIDVRPGYASGRVSINVLDAETTGFADASCGWTSSGETTFSQIEVTVHGKQWKESLCLEDLRATWLSMQLQASAFGEALPFAEAIADAKTKQVKKYVEQLLGTDIISQVTSANGASLQTTPAPAAWTSSNALAQANGLINALPSKVLSRTDLMMFMSYASFRALNQNIVSSNLFHYPTGPNQLGTGLGQQIVIPGTNVVAVPVAGFGTSNRVIAGPSKQLIAVTGLLDDQDRLEIWYSKDNDEIRTMAKFRIGVGALASEFATNDLA